MLGNIPTDNFYKFQFFAGLLIILSINYFLFSRSQIDTSDVIKLQGAIDKLEFDNQVWNRNADQLQSKMKSHFEDSSISSQEIQKFIQRSDSISVSAKRLYAEYIKVQTNKKLVSESVKNTSRFLNWSIFAFIIAICWVAYGSWGWYFRHQKYKDIIIKADAEIRQQELKKMKQDRKKTT